MTDHDKKVQAEALAACAEYLHTVARLTIIPNAEPVLHRVAEAVLTLKPYASSLEELLQQNREITLSAVILHLTPFREELDRLLCDEDLTDEKLRDASEGLLPRLADAIRRIRQLKRLLETKAQS